MDPQLTPALLLPSKRLTQPARARRSKLKQEVFINKKMAENSEKQNVISQAAHDAGDTVSFLLLKYEKLQCVL